jgi:hypothetical protein
MSALKYYLTVMNEDKTVILERVYHSPAELVQQLPIVRAEIEEMINNPKEVKEGEKE